MEENDYELIDATEEEPWCSACEAFSDYKRRWSCWQRSNTDGGVYSSNEEAPYCVSCGSKMTYLKECMLLIRFFRTCGFLSLTVAGLICFALFEPGILSCTIFFISLAIACGITRIPRKSLRAIRQRKKFLKEKSAAEKLERKLLDTKGR